MKAENSWFFFITDPSGPPHSLKVIRKTPIHQNHIHQISVCCSPPAHSILRMVKEQMNKFQYFNLIKNDSGISQISITKYY
jgi:hypothetical protein